MAVEGGTLGQMNSELKYLHTQTGQTRSLLRKGNECFAWGYVGFECGCILVDILKLKKENTGEQLSTWKKHGIRAI